MQPLIQILMVILSQYQLEKNQSLGQTFVSGKANPDVKKYSGDIIYVDNRAPVTRTPSQKEEVKIVIEF